MWFIFKNLSPMVSVCRGKATVERPRNLVRTTRTDPWIQVKSSINRVRTHPTSRTASASAPGPLLLERPISHTGAESKFNGAGRWLQARYAFDPGFFRCSIGNPARRPRITHPESGLCSQLGKRCPSALLSGPSQGSKFRHWSMPSLYIGWRTCSELAVRTLRSVR